MNQTYQMGIDIGSTTVKVVIKQGEALLYKIYTRHFSQVRQKTVEILQSEPVQKLLEGGRIQVAITGSAGLGVSKASGVSFVQEVYATGEAVKRFMPDTDVVIELGGEDAKIIFLTGGVEERMNGSCAGGTGAFIDQMASLLDVSLEELDALSLQAERTYTIASRCGVFAKSDIQPLLNQGARKEDVAASIFQAVVDQTITGLAQGRAIKGKVLFLGGPLHFFMGLRKRFVLTLGLDEEHALFPELGQYTIAEGAALYAAASADSYSYEELLDKLQSTTGDLGLTQYLEPLFKDREEYDTFLQRHAKASVEYASLEQYTGDAYLGVDCGSTTTKLVLLGQDDQILYSYYSSNKGSPVTILREQLLKLYSLCGDRVRILASTATGYGEELVRNAFGIDFGIVETMAHFRAAKFFNPNVDFIIDIGGQDIKCFKIKNNAIDNIMLNEACSSGCGSFIETFAKSVGYSVQDYCKLGLFSKYPIDLGSRCTVFMNSSVKQAQKDGAGVEDISAGLAISVVKNALYKVIRARNPEELGQHIVVQGGTFLNDAVLRSFEREIGRDVVRPSIAGLMGAFGAALYAKRYYRDNPSHQTALLTLEQLEQFHHEAKATKCRLCTNNCNLTVNTFSSGEGKAKRFISGNRCERPLGLNRQELPDMFRYKLERLQKYGRPNPFATRGQIGLVFGLNFYELLPFWHTFFTKLGFEVVISDVSSRKMYSKGQYSIPSDTVCYPAKLIHGHIENLLEKGVSRIFYPCMSYNINEKKGDNFYNCPVVAYYPELLHANMSSLNQPGVDFIMPYLGIHEPKRFKKHITPVLKERFADITFKVVSAAADAAYEALNQWQSDVQAEGQRAISLAREQGRQIIVLAGRPYHVDPEINHGINQMLSSFGLVVITEDCVAGLVDPVKVNVLNQWTYHARLYNAAKYVSQQPDMQLIQLVSFGCGIDAITTDEVRSILENPQNPYPKLYTQIKIDEINNLGAAKIRIRSMLEVVADLNASIKTTA